MAQYNLTNSWIEFRYTTKSIQHVQKFQVNAVTTIPTADPDTVNLLSRDGTLFTLTGFALEWTAALAGYFDNTQSTFDSMTLWHQPDTANEPTFISAADPTAVTWQQPTGTGGDKDGAQETQTYRCSDGKILKIVLLETVSQPHYRVALSDVSAAHLTPLINYMMSGSCIPQSRSGAYPLLAMNRTGVYNDKLVRTRFKVD